MSFRCHFDVISMLFRLILGCYTDLEGVSVAERNGVVSGDGDGRPHHQRPLVVVGVRRVGRAVMGQQEGAVVQRAQAVTYLERVHLE